MVKIWINWEVNLVVNKTRKPSMSYEDSHKITNGIELKLCNTCEEWFPMTEEFYYKNKSSKIDGFNPYCKECTKKKSSKWQKDNPERYKEIRKATEEKPRTKLLKREMSRKLSAEGKRKEWQKKNKDKLYNYGRERVLNKTHEISKEEWEHCLAYFDFSCAYCGLSEQRHKELYSQRLHKEHVDPKGANDLSNNIPSCKICNSKKHDYTLEEWYRKDNELCGSYSYERLEKIKNWLNEGYKLYIMNL